MRNQRFEVGEIARLRYCRQFPELVGAELTITGPYQRFENEVLGVWYGYPSDLVGPDGKKIAPAPWQLEKLGPPKVASDRNNVIPWEMFIKHIGFDPRTLNLERMQHA